MGLIARGIEETGIPTITISSARDITESVKPPRTTFLDFPLGYTTGRPFERELQLNILRDSFNAMKTMKEPATIIDLPYLWPEGDSWKEEVLRD